MWDQEKEHLQKFEQIIAERRVRPTLLVPLWNVAGYVLGTDDEHCDLYRGYVRVQKVASSYFSACGLMYALQK